MGELIGGVWHGNGIGSAISGGTLKRPPSVFKNWLSAGDDGPFPAEPGRYHLYVALACPWANRTLIMRNLKGLESIVDISIVHWLMGEDGWTFEPARGSIPDTVNGAKLLRDLYVLSDPECTSRVSVPVLWDKKTSRIVSNDSADILRMFGSVFDRHGALPGDYYPEAHRAEIDAVTERLQVTLNNGVYRAGFATEQNAYDEAVNGIFETLDWLEERLATRRHLVGDGLTEADIRLFPTLVRFDPVYLTHFKCNKRPLVEYPVLWAYTRDLYGRPAFRRTIDFQHIKNHYYRSHPWVNPNGLVPIGPLRDFDAPSGRDGLDG